MRKKEVVEILEKILYWMQDTNDRIETINKVLFDISTTVKYIKPPEAKQ